MDSFNGKFINNWKDLQSANIGLEFEFYSNYSYIKTMELLNIEFSPIEVWGFNEYHSDFKVTSKVFKVEPDYSGGSDMLELITGPTSWLDARIILIKALKFISEYGYTDDHCSIHVNISFNDLNVISLNPIKLILNFDEDFIYAKFPDRRNNIYAKSIKKIVPFEDWNDSETALNSIIQSLKLPDDTKYYGINLQKKLKNYLEFRYIGGENYEPKSDDILSLMDYFVLQTRKAITEPLTDEDNIKLFTYLEDNINWFKQYKTYNDFLANIDGINIEYDKNPNYKLIDSSWDKIKSKLFEVIKACESINDVTINYNSTTNRLELVDGNFTNVNYLRGVDFINSTITNCTIYNCDLISTTVSNGHIYNSNLYEAKISNTKLNSCNALDWTELTDCVFDGGKLDCIMTGGVFRSGQLLENADIDISVKMANKDSFWSVSPGDKKIGKYK